MWDLGGESCFRKSDLCHPVKPQGAETSVSQRLNPAWGAGPTRRALGLSRGSDSVLGVNVRVGCS